MVTDQEWTPRSALFVFLGRGEARLGRGDGSVAVSEVDMDRRFSEEPGKAGELARLVEPVVEELGFSLVRVKVSGRDGGTVQVMIERPGGQIGVEDCAAVSRRLSPLLDAYDPFPGGYRLEISSPGVDRPLVRPRDFAAWSGQEVKIELKELVDGRKRFRGEIEGFEEGEVRLRVALEGDSEPVVMGFPLSLIAEAKLVLSDDLLRAAAKS